MHYWAKNGSPYWITCAGNEPEQFSIIAQPFEKVTYTYVDASWWTVTFSPEKEINPMGNKEKINW